MSNEYDKIWLTGFKVEVDEEGKKHYFIEDCFNDEYNEISDSDFASIVNLMEPSFSKFVNKAIARL